MEAGTTSPWGDWAYPQAPGTAAPAAAPENPAAPLEQMAPHAAAPMPAPRPRANPDDARNRRVLAVLADNIVLLLGWLATVTLVNDGDQISFVVWAVLITLVTFAYYAIPEALFGQTLGKALFDVRIVDNWGTQPSAGKVVVRTLMRWVDNVIVAIIAINVTGAGRRQRTGDIAAGTFVIRASQSPLERGSEAAIATICIGVALIPAALMLTPGPRGHHRARPASRANHTATAYLTAAINGDTASACRLMSPGEKRAIVARGMHAYVGAASDADCQRFAAPFLRRDAKRYAAAGGPPIVLATAGGNTMIAAHQGPQGAGYDGLGTAVVGMTRDGDDWRVDQLAADRAGFVESCQATSAGGFTDHTCGCMFDELRGRGYESERQLIRILRTLEAGGEAEDLVAAAQSCAPSGP